MNQSLPKPAHALGIYAGFGFFDVPFADRLSMIRDAGFDATALWWEEDRAEIRRMRHLAPDMVRKAGLYLDNIHVPYKGCNALWSPDPDERAACVARHTAWVEDCARHGIPTMVMHVSLGRTPPPVEEQGVESFHRIVDAAEDAGVNIAIENTRSNAHLETLLDTISSPALGLCFDTSHDALYSATPLALLRDWGHRLHTTHLSDIDGRRDRHWIPGEGSIDFEGVAAHFPLDSYRGAMMLEVKADRGEPNAPSYLSRAYRAAQALSDVLFSRGSSKPISVTGRV